MPESRFFIGHVEVVCLTDIDVELPVPLSQLFPGVPLEAWAPWRERYPEIFPGPDSWRAHFGSFLLRSQGRTILVDTGIGTHATNPGSVALFTRGQDGRLLAELAAVGALPGFSGVASFVSQALLDGSVNALLTLRVGCLASRYCATMTALDQDSIRRAATSEAVSLISRVLLNSAGTVSTAIWDAAKRSRVGGVATSIGRVVEGAADTVSTTASEVAETVTTGVSEAAKSMRTIVSEATETVAINASEVAQRMTAEASGIAKAVTSNIAELPDRIALSKAAPFLSGIGGVTTDALSTVVKKGRLPNPFRESQATAEEAHGEGSSPEELRDPTEPHGGPPNADARDASP